MADRFPSPFDVPTPPGAEGWEEMYTYSSLFGPARREYEESTFWFQDGVHWPDVLTPWEATFFEYAMASLSQYNSRHLLVPPSDGIDFRILNGYAYLSPVAAPADRLQERIAAFVDRAGHYFTHWDELYAAWMLKIRDLVQELDSLRFEPLPEAEDADAVVKAGLGYGSGYLMIEHYQRLLSLGMLLWQYHFEFLNLGYAAYLDFFGFCKRAFPSIPDLAIAKMVAGVDVELFRPDEELKRLARKAFEDGIGDVFDLDDVADVVAALRSSPAGAAWLAAFDEAAEPWFNFSTGSGFYHSDKVWNEHLEVPFGFIRSYVAKLRLGEDLVRPVEAIRAERDRIVSEYAELLPLQEDRVAFHQKLGLARVVFPYVENHNFYVEHWSHAIIWRKMRALGAVLTGAGFLAGPDDVFYLRRTEVLDALWDLYASWATPAPAAGPAHWPPVVTRRRGMVTALRSDKPAPALGCPPPVVTEPFTVMLWGITSASIDVWLGRAEHAADELSGFAASPGVAEGPARVISGADEIGTVQQGEVLVAPLTAPSWAPLFGRVAATVTDTGGMMSHAAIVCREYGLPAVTGTGFATARIRTGQRVRVDGSRGTVTILD